MVLEEANDVEVRQERYNKWIVNVGKKRVKFSHDDDLDKSHRQ